MKQRILIKQIFRVEREIVVEIEADNAEEAVEMLDTGAVDTPAFDEPHWRTGWTLQSAYAEPAPAESI